jgi:hypothetical protein
MTTRQQLFEIADEARTLKATMTAALRGLHATDARANLAAQLGYHLHRASLTAAALADTFSQTEANQENHHE